MKHSNVQWIGQIPDDWKLERLQWHLYEIKESNDPVKTEQVLSLTNKLGVIPYEEKGEQGNKSKENLTEYKLAYPNTIVANSMNILIGSVGICNYFGCVSPVYYVFKPKENENIDFLNYIFQTEQFQKELRKYANGILEIRLRLSSGNILKRLVAFPSVEKQKGIVEFLNKKCSEIDQLVEIENQQIEKLKEYKQSVITEAVTKGLDKNAKMKDSGVEWIGKIPENWKVKRLKNIGWFMSGISNKKPEDFGLGFPFVNYKNICRNFILDMTTDEKVNSTIEDRKKYNIQYGDLFFTGSSETVEELGFSSVAMNDYPNAVWNGFCIRMRPYSFAEYNPKYFVYLTRSDISRNYLNANDNSITRANLSQKRLGNLPIVIPPLNEQDVLVKYIDDKFKNIDKIIEIKNKKIEELQDYKKSIIYEYVTGKKEVQ